MPVFFENFIFYFFIEFQLLRQLLQVFSLILQLLLFLTPSLTGFGADSTKSLASFNPKFVASRTTLITFNFCSPADFKITLKTCFFFG
ncbi:MAG: hypothetical protein KatS3mg093_297 [Candidatus Parcubacteria bacterium]|nr:MAG: hypothetical protein KatS3mg093_297 [Candidatus Parcubacteria bacterium]